MSTKERPIVFSSLMVQAILDDRKTQTRRVANEFAGMPCLDGILKRFPRQNGCRYGAPGDRLWVRETWQRNIGNGPPIIYRADHGEATGVYKPDPASGAWEIAVSGWRPSIFMRRLDSRILLEITDVRVERLQEISEDDARAEGYSPKSHHFPTGWFRDIWESINGTGSWDANPWVWAITFRRLQP
jgi:hypothetical protein